MSTASTSASLLPLSQEPGGKDQHHGKEVRLLWALDWRASYFSEDELLIIFVAFSRFSNKKQLC